jgi:hypothetical protein
MILASSFVMVGRNVFAGLSGTRAPGSNVFEKVSAKSSQK